ncbi:hypothetical protein ACFV4N_08210 [Actinosynnema sp. NPDC059797]
MVEVDRTALARRGVELAREHQRTGDLVPLREAVDLLRRAVDVTDPPPGMWSNLCAALFSLHIRTGDVEALVDAVHAGRRAVEGAPDEPRYLSNLAAMLKLLFQVTTDCPALVEAVEAARRAVAASEPDDAALAGRLANSSASLRTLYEQTGDVEALREAVAAGRTATTLDVVVESAVVWANLANALWDLSERTQDDRIASEALDAFRAACEAVPEHDGNRPAMLANLAYRWSAVAVRNSDYDGLSSAVDLARRSVAATDERDPDRAHNEGLLASVLRGRFNLTGDVRALAEAADVACSAVDRTGDNSADLALRLAEAGTTLRALYERTGEAALLDRAVEATERSVEVIPVGHVWRANILAGAVTTLILLFERTRDDEVLRRAVSLGRLAAAEHSAPQPDDTRLIIPLVALAVHTGDHGLLDEAVELGRRAAAPAEGRRVAKDTLANTAYALVNRYAHSHDADDLRAAIAFCVLAAGSVEKSADAPHEPAVLITLGGALLELGGHISERRALDDARTTFTHVVRSTVATATERLRAWRGLGRVELAAGDPTAAVAAYEEAVVLLPSLAPRRLTRGDREFGLGRAAGLASDAAAAAVAAGRPDRAVELLEQARVLLQAETMDARGDLRVLEGLEPELHREFHRLRNALDAAEHPVADAMLVASPQQRARLKARLTAVLTEIRSRPRLRGFLLPGSAAELAAHADEGAIAIVYVGRSRADALVLRKGRPVEVVPLQSVTHASAAAQVDRFGSAQEAATTATTYSGRVAAHATMHEVLEWSWDEVVEPVLDHLGLGGESEEAWPRLWWCPGGVF